MSGKGANPQEQVQCPKCGKRVQRRYLRRHERSVYQGVRRRRHACPYCTAEICKTYSTFQDWKNHLHATHKQCLEEDDPVEREEYAAGFKLDRWERFHDIKGDIRPGLSAHSHPAETLWPIPGSSTGRAAGTTVYHPPSARQGHHTRPRRHADGVGAGWERAGRLGTGGRKNYADRG